MALTVQSTYFYALSWLIRELGNWKDALQLNEELSRCLGKHDHRSGGPFWISARD